MSEATRSVPRRVVDALTVGGYRAGALASRLAPRTVAHAVGATLARSAALASPERRALVERNLRRVDPSLRGERLRDAVRGAFESYARYYVESFRLPWMSAARVDRAFSVEGFEHIEAAVAAGKGTIFALPHLGGWEWAGRWIVDRGYPLTVVVEALQPPELFEWFARLRADLGMKVIAADANAGTAVLRALRANEIVCLLCDRDLDGTGVEVEFFGERTTLPAGPATLALRTGAALLPVGAYFEPSRRDGHHAVVRPPLDVRREGTLRADVARITQALAGELEGVIRRAPEQWHLFQPNWPSDNG